MHLLALWLTLGVALADPSPADFTGTWALNLKESDNMDDLLTVMGRSFVEKVTAKTLSVTQTIKQTGTTIEISVSSFIIGRDETLRIDGTPTVSLDQKGNEVQSVTLWEGSVLVTTTEGTTADGGTMPMSLRRYLSGDGKKMIQEIRYTVSGETRMAKRVFDRTAG